MFDFLVRAYVPHVLLAIAAALLFHSQPHWPDETWAKQYEPVRETAYRSWQQQWMYDRGTPERLRAGREYDDATRRMIAIDARLSQGRAPVLAALAKRTALLALLTVLTHLLTDTLVSPGDRLRLFAEGPSYLRLVAGAVVTSGIASLVACRDARIAATVFLLADGIALTWLLLLRDAFGNFDRARLAAERRDWVAQWRDGGAAARREVQHYFAAHTDLLREVFPEALFRSALNAAIPDGAEPAQAWAAARELIEQLRERIEKEKEARRQSDERRQQAETSARKTRTEVEGLRQRIDALTGRDDEESLEALAMLRRQMRQIQGHSTRNTVTPDDL